MSADAVLYSAWMQDIDRLLLSATLGAARIAPAMFFLPYLRPKLVGGAILRRSLLVIIAVGLAPLYLVDVGQLTFPKAIPVIAQEVVIGFFIGFAMAVPFTVAMAIGELVDNQRGATISSAMDPAVGIKASPFASFFNLFWAAAFAAGGGLLLVVEVLAESYQLFPVASRITFDPSIALAAASLMSRGIAKGIILAAPMVIAMYLTELALGVLSRFASQLNPFSMAMTLKSIVMLVVMLIYFGPGIPVALFGLFDGAVLTDLIDVKSDVKSNTISEFASDG